MILKESFIIVILINNITEFLNFILIYDLICGDQIF